MYKNAVGAPGGPGASQGSKPQPRTGTGIGPSSQRALARPDDSFSIWSGTALCLLHALQPGGIQS